MSNQTHREPVKDLAKKRRDYLHDWSSNSVFAGLGAVVAVGAGIFLVLLVSFCRELHLNWAIVFFLTAMACIIGICAIGVFQMGFKEASVLPYVPPVAEQIVALPADEILLRSSNEPTATPDELLRVAHSRTTEPAEELLRVSVMPTEGRS